MKERLPMGTFPSYLEKFIEPESCRKCNSREKCKQVINEGNDAIRCINYEKLKKFMTGE